MAVRERRSLTLTFAVAIVLALALAVIAGQVIGGHVGRRTTTDLLAGLPASAPSLVPGRHGPDPMPLPMPTRHP
ncbi:MAG TPA: hypothetical protein VIJ94_17990 [Caulobacteraceae bacterium]